jgi:glycosyltransferase involved in cell wall biosynthesis
MISTIILTKNEEKNIERCLASLKFVDEIIVVDDLSQDKTVELTKGKHAVVYERALANDFAGQKNFAMQQAKGDWILFVDADEELSKELADEIQKITTDKDNNIEVYHLRRRDFFWGTELKYGETSSARNTGIIRLMKKGVGKWNGTVHETFQPTGSTGKLSGFLNHYPHQTIREFLQEVNYYSTVRAKELYKQGKKPNIFVTVAWPLGKFLYTYFFKLGILDGAAGFVYAFLMSFHSFLVRVKLEEYGRR